MTHQATAHGRLIGVGVGRRDEQVRDREAPAAYERRVAAGGAERVRPEIARDVGEHAGAVALAVDEARAVRERGHAVQHGVEHLARRPTVLADDRDQRTGIALVAHRYLLRKQKSPPVLGGFVGLDVSLSRRDSASTSGGDSCGCGRTNCHWRNF